MTPDVTALSVEAYTQGAKTPEEVQAYVEQRMGAAPAEPAVAPTPDAATPPAEPPTPAQPPAAEPAIPHQFDYSRYDAKDDDDLYNKYDQLKKSHAELSELKPKWEKVAPIVEVADYIKNPFNDPIVQQLNNVMSQGIKDPRLAIEMLTTTTEELRANPIKALTMAKILEDNSVIGMPIDRIERQVRRENGIGVDADFNEIDADLKETIEFKAAKALKTIDSKKSEWGQSKDIFASWEEQAQTANAAKAKVVEEWGKHLPKIVSGLTEIKMEVDAGKLGKIPVTVPVTKEEVSSAMSLMSGSLSNINPDANGQAQLSEALRSVVRTAKTDQLIVAAIEHYDNTIRASVEQEERKKSHNGGPVQTPAPGGDPKRDETMEAIRKLSNPTTRND